MSIFIEDKLKKHIDNDLNRLESLVWDFFIKKVPNLGFESREGQEDMALDIVSSIKDKQHMIVEAGVGIGKSYAYIVPLMYYNMIFKKPVLIATSTIALQEQLIKDIRKISNYINHKPEIVLAKGMTHFVCKNRSESFFKNFKGEYTDEIKILNKYIEIGKSDRKDINIDVDEEIWECINVKSTEHSKCKYFKNCAFMELRERMLNTKGIIICNQDLLTVHYQKLKNNNKGLISSDIDLIVIDEAHNLEEKVRNSLVEKYNEKYIKKITKEAFNNLSTKEAKDRFKVLLLKLNTILKSLFKALDFQIKDQLKANKDTERFFINKSEIIDSCKDLYILFKEIYNLASIYQGDNLLDETLEEIINVQRFFERITKINTNNLFWLEKDRYTNILSCPKEIDSEIKRLFFDNLKTTILTSATVANKVGNNEQESYEYFIKSIGFPVEKGYLSQPKPSPFPYKENTMLFYTDNMPHPTLNRDDYIKKATDKIIELLKISNGKSLILFTSKNDLNDTYKILKTKDFNFNILKQRKESSQNEILEMFKEDTNSVLLATGTFWEGIDVPGKALENLIIFKLPFPPSDPILEYKKSISNNFLLEVATPIMITKLRQGVGRLIRKNTDKGIVCILDSRIGDLYNSSYKEIVFNSLPIKNKTSDIKVLREFYEKVNNIS